MPGSVSRQHWYAWAGEVRESIPCSLWAGGEALHMAEAAGGARGSTGASMACGMVSAARGAASCMSKLWGAAPASPAAVVMHSHAQPPALLLVCRLMRRCARVDLMQAQRVCMHMLAAEPACSTHLALHAVERH